MRERTCILLELRGAEQAHILDPLDRGRSLVGGELLIAEDGEPLLERELEPIATGDSIARPVVEIFVGDDAGDRVVIGVSRRVRIGENVARVEDVEALVLHRAEVEVGDRDDVEHRKVVLAAVDALVPGHRGLERSHRVLGPGQVGLTNPDAELDRLA